MARAINIMEDKIRVGRHNGRIHKMLYKKVVPSTITHNKRDKQRNGGNVNDTMQNVAENIQHSSIKPIRGLLIELCMKPI